MSTRLLSSDDLRLDVTVPDKHGRVSIIASARPRLTASLGLFSMVPSGPSLALGAAPTFDDQGKASFSLPKPLPDGLYVAVLTDPPADNGLPNPPFLMPPAGHVFWVGDKQPADLGQVLVAAILAQHAFRNKEIRQRGYVGSEKRIVHVVLDRCLLDFRQVFAGGSLMQMPASLGVQSIVEAVNQLLPYDRRFVDVSVLDASFKKNHPLTLATFHNVAADGIEPAISAVSSHVERILGALTIERGATPVPITYLVEQDGAMSLVLSEHNYRGNLLGGFGPGVTPLLDIIEAASLADPWIDFAINLFRVIKLQTRPAEALFQSWSMLEAVAKRTVPKNSSIKIMSDAGQERSHQGKDVGRTIVYLRDYVKHIFINRRTVVGELWEVVSRVYNARNAIAHEGGINAPATEKPVVNIDDLSWLVQHWAEKALLYELGKAANLPTQAGGSVRLVAGRLVGGR